MSKDFVTVATFNTESEAEPARIFLRSHNIEAHLLDTEMTSATISISGASGYTDVRVRVHPKDAERAQQLIKEYRHRETKQNAPKLIPPPADGVMLCPACNCDSFNRETPTVIIFFVFLPCMLAATIAVLLSHLWIGITIMSIVVIYLFYAKKSYRCQGCYHSWKVSDKA